MRHSANVKLSETLASLIEARGFSRARKKICAAVGITPSALSQYMQGGANPSFDTLVALAEFFEVSLDYLVFGTPETTAVPIDYGPVVRYVDVALAAAQARSNQHAATFTRIARALAAQIEDAAKRVAADGTPAGLLHEDETMALEACSLDTRIICTSLQADIIERADEPVIGRFLLTVARNLSLGRRYSYLLPARPGWRPLVNAYLRLLEQHCGETQKVLRNCRFRVARVPIFVGCGFYRLHTSTLQTEHPILWERFGDAIDQEGWLGYVQPPSGESHADALMDRAHLENGVASFDKLWRGAEPLG